MPSHSRKTILLATDHQRSVINALDENRPQHIAYTPYGHRPAENGLLSLLGFNGERPDPLTGHYHLGNGYRQFNPVLMRFNSPDSLSPFGEGGVNAYAYCGGDPSNRVDPTGHSFLGSLFKGAKNFIGVRHPSKFHKQNIDNILNGAQLNYGTNVIADGLKSGTLKPINLEKISKNKIIQYIGATNADSRPIYDIVKQQRYNMEATSPLSNQLHELTSHHRVLTHAQIMDVPKYKLAIELAKSVEFNKNVKTAKNLLPKKADRIPNADNELSSQNTVVRSS